MYYKLKFFFTFFCMLNFAFLIYNSAAAHDSTPINSSTKQATLSISGTHTIVIEHDEATIHANVETHAPTAKEATVKNAVIMDKIRQALKGVQINPDKLMSNGYNVHANYDYVKSEKVFRDYQVVHQISLLVKNLDNVGNLTDLLTASGVNQISNIQFSSSQIHNAYDVALKNAVIDAKKKAELALSGLKNTSIGQAVHINVLPSSNSRPPVMYKNAVAPRGMALEAVSTPTNFKTQGQTITVHVNTIWELISR